MSEDHAQQEGLWGISALLILKLKIKLINLPGEGGPMMKRLEIHLCRGARSQAHTGALLILFLH